MRTVLVVINDFRRYDVRWGAANNLRTAKLAASSSAPTRSFLPPSCVYLPTTTTIIATGTSFPPIYLSAAAIQSHSRFDLSTLTTANPAAPTTTYTAHGDTCASDSLLHHLPS